MRKITYKRFELLAYITILIGLIFVSVKMYFPKYFDMHSKNKLFVVVSDSMDLTIAPHSSIIVDKSKDYIVVDDIITFKYDLNDDGYKEIITHRLHAIEDGIYKTMSDKYNQIDRWIYIWEWYYWKSYFSNSLSWSHCFRSSESYYSNYVSSTILNISDISQKLN